MRPKPPTKNPNDKKGTGIPLSTTNRPKKDKFFKKTKKTKPVENPRGSTGAREGEGGSFAFESDFNMSKGGPILTKTRGTGAATKGLNFQRNN